MTGKRCPCGCAILPRYGRCLRRRLAAKIDTLTARLEWQRDNRSTKGFRSTWEAREALREQLAALPAGGSQ